jgi:protein SCO1/2
MRQRARQQLLAVALGLLSASACESAHEGLPYYRTAELTPEWLSAGTARSPDMHRIAAFALTDQRGATITQSQLRGRVTLVHFFFASCGRVCPRAVSSIQRLLDRMPSDSQFQVLSHTVQPARDSVGALRAYAEQRHIADARWHLLTGSWSRIDSLASRSYFVNLRDGRAYGTDDLVHTETLVLVDQDARIRGVYNATLELDMRQIEVDAHALLYPATP